MASRNIVAARTMQISPRPMPPTIRDARLRENQASTTQMRAAPQHAATAARAGNVETAPVPDASRRYRTASPMAEALPSATGPQTPQTCTAGREKRPDTHRPSAISRGMKAMRPTGTPSVRSTSRGATAGIPMILMMTHAAATAPSAVAQAPRSRIDRTLHRGRSICGRSLMILLVVTARGAAAAGGRAGFLSAAETTRSATGAAMAYIQRNEKAIQTAGTSSAPTAIPATARSPGSSRLLMVRSLAAIATAAARACRGASRARGRG